MKNNVKIKALAVLVTALSISGVGLCSNFENTNSYNNNFTDVSPTDWYAGSVKDAYNFGLMTGESDTIFNPDGTLTVAEGITIASRIHKTVNGTVIPEVTEGEWYRKYVDYAIDNGIITQGQFDGYELNIKRFEIAQLFAAACNDLPEINNISTLPDVAQGASYADAVLELYNAGILGGNDAYGTFAPYSYLKRSEISAMAVRVADSTRRVNKALLPLEARALTDSYYIIEAVTSSGPNGLSNGWNYDNRFEIFNSAGKNTPCLSDASDEKFYSLIRDFDTENEGIFQLETVMTVNSGDNGVYLELSDPDGKTIFKLTPQNGVWTLTGENATVASTVGVTLEVSKEYAFVADIDLDNGTVEVSINNTYLGQVDIADNSRLSRLVIGTSKEGVGVVVMSHVRLVKNRPINDHFMVTGEQIGEKPLNWDVSGDFALDVMHSVKGSDIYSVKAETMAGNRSTAQRSFIPITGKVGFETYILLPEKSDGARVSLMSGDTEVFTFETKDDCIYMADTLLHDYIPNVWQSLYIEADTNTGEAFIRINGKKKAEVEFNARVFDGVKIEYAPDADGVMWFDDVEIYNLIDHADYPEYPVVAESTDYNVGINSCYLWRDTQSGEGWDSTSAFPEFDTYLGFYDEGLRESADWELKMMAEHGIDFIHACWYCPNGHQIAPIKRMRVSHSALHDGYMHAKYSDLVDFCIMWENNGQDVTSFEQFKEYIWPYWKEYYFADERYARLDNKAVLSIWNRSKMESAFGGVEGTNAAIEFMSDELKEMGYDGIILLGTNASMASEQYYEGFDSLGFDATYAYNYGRTGYDPEYQTDRNRNNAEVSMGVSHHIPTISVGFNDVGRNESRHPIISVEDFLAVCEDSKDILSRYDTGTWMDNTVILSTWNEYSEGTYIMPCEGNGGYGYLEAVRTAFTNDTRDHTHVDVRLTPTQLERVGHLYPPNHAPIRWHQFEKASGTEEMDQLDPATLVTVRPYDMSFEADANAWVHAFGLDSFSNENGVISGSSSVGDYAIISNELEMFEAEDAPILHIRLKTSEVASLEVFFITTSDTTWNNKKYVSTPITKSGEFVDYYLNMNYSGCWTGTIAEIRIDPLTTAGSFEISHIDLMNFPEEDLEKIPTVLVNDMELVLTFYPEVLDDSDYAVVGEARNKGFYSSMRLYHEWDRFTGDGVLTLFDRDGNEYVFAVGSDTIYVNGAPQALGYTFTLRDGLPVFHIKKLCDLLGYEYTQEGNTINIISALPEEYEQIRNSVPNCWEFEVGGETEGWSAQGGTVMSYDGMLVHTCSHFDLAVIRNVFFYAADYTHVVVGVEYQKELMDKSTPQLFFTTKSDTKFTAEKCINGKYITEGKNDGDIIEVIFDLNDNSMFSGTITGLRFDPYNHLSNLKVDYIRCVNNPDLTPGDVLIEVDDENQWYFDGDSIDKWGTKGDPYTVSDGVLTVQGTDNDPGILRTVSFSASDYQFLVVGIKYTEELQRHSGQMFFITKESPAWESAKGLTSNYRISSATTIGDTVEIRFDLTRNSLWTGTVTGIRFDPFGVAKEYAIDYVRLYKKG